MTANRTANLFHRIRADRDESDADLLQRFAQSRDAAAFAALVQRHGPLVFGICRRTLGHVHDAEDAFQAVFLVLAQKAGRLRDSRLLSSWLYGVAWRVAKKAKRRAARRREEPRASVPEPPTVDVPMNDLGPVLDEELAALPEWYREAVLACDVMQLTRTEAAAKLGIPEGTLSSRLAAGRKRLAERLARRSVTLSVPLFASVASAAVPEALIQHAVEAAVQWAAGGAVAKPITELTHEGLTMVRKLLLLGTGILAAGAVGFGLAGDPAKPEDAKPPQAAEKVAPVVVAAKPETVFGPPRQRGIVNVDGGYSAIHWSGDGQRVAVSGTVREPSRVFGATNSFTRIWKFGEGGLQALSSPTEKVVGDVLGLHPKEEACLLLHVQEFGGINVRNSLVSHMLKMKEMTKSVDLSDDYFNFQMMTTGGRAMLMAGYDEARREHTVHEIDYTTGQSNRVVFRTSGEFFFVSEDASTAVTGTRVAKKIKVEIGNGITRENEEQILTEFQVWDCKKNQKRFSWKLPDIDIAPSYVISRDARTLAFGVDKTVYLLDAVSGREIKRFAVADKRVLVDVVLSHDGRLAVVTEVDAHTAKVGPDTGSPGGAAPPPTPGIGFRTPKYVTVYDTASGKPVKKWETNLMLMMAFAPDRPALAILECPDQRPVPGSGGMPGGMGPGPMGGSTATAQGRLGIWEFATEKR